MVVEIFGAALLAFALNVALTPLILKLALHKDWLDTPNQRSVHKEPIPRLGGVGIFLAFALALLALFLWGAFSNWKMPAMAYSVRTLWVGLGLVSTLILGVMDDFLQFRAVYKFLLQMFGAVAALAAGLVITEVTIPFLDWHIELGVFGPLLTVIWVVGITNAVNLIDGMDGLAGGFSTLAFLFLGMAMALTEHWFAAMVCFLLVGAILGFLVFNFPPAKIFMGDTGSLAIGYLMAILPLWGSPDGSLFHQLWLLPFTVVLIPVGDTTAAIVRRIRQGVPVWAPDKEHTHHKLLRLGFSTKQVLAIVYGTFLLTGSPVLFQSILEANRWGTSWLLVLSVGSVVVVTGLFTLLHVVYRRRFPDPQSVAPKA